MKYRAIAAVIGIGALIAGALINGCGGGGRSNGSLQVYLADDPLDAKAVNVTISRIDVAKAEDAWTTLVDFGSSPVTIDLLDYRYDGDTSTPDQYLLADRPLAEGHYTQIRLILTKIEIVDSSDAVHECAMNSQDKTGLKLVGEFDVAPGTMSAVLIDFNVAKSIVEMGNGTYRLQPTVKVVPLQVTGSVHGVVVFKNKSGGDVPVPEGAAISAYQNSTLAGSALIDSEGKFGIGGLVAGTYTLKLETPGFTAPDTEVTVTPQTDADAGTITATAQ